MSRRTPECTRSGTLFPCPTVVRSRFGGLFARGLLWKLVTLPFRAWRGHRDKQSRARLGGGLEALHHGHYARAQKLLEQAAADDESAAGVARSAAAQAAQIGRAHV